MLNKLSELDLLTCLIYGEARGESWAGKCGVALTVQTRVEHPGHWNWGENWREVILCPKQFSCFDDHNLSDMLKAYAARSVMWAECFSIAEKVYAGTMISYIGSPTHYHAMSVHPSWTSKLTFLSDVGNHKFYTCFKPSMVKN